MYVDKRLENAHRDIEGLELDIRLLMDERSSLKEEAERLRRVLTDAISVIEKGLLHDA